jgi:uncharacterized protein
VDRAVVEALLDGGLDQAVLIDPREAVELRRVHGGAQVIAGAGLIDHLDLGAGQRRHDHRLYFHQVGHGPIVWGGGIRALGSGWMEPEKIRFRAGGEHCAGWLFRPVGNAGGPAPCVVLGTGISCVYDQGLSAFAERFAQAGFVALAFDYRNCGESGGEPRSLILAGRQREDWRAAISYVRSLEEVDTERIALWGYSLGGGHVQALALDETRIAAAVCLAPVVNGVRTLTYMGGVSHVLRLGVAGLRDGLRWLRGAEPHLVPAAGPPGSNAVLNSPGSLPGFASVTPPGSNWRNEVSARAALAPPYRLARKAGRIRCPILYCIATEDDVNPPALGRRAAASAPRGELRLYPGGHFDPFLGETFERISADQVDFLRRSLTPSPEARPG